LGFSVLLCDDAEAATFHHSIAVDAERSLGEPFKRKAVSFPAFGDESTALFSQLRADSDPSSLAIIYVRVGRPGLKTPPA
jgi:hypothetical protein